MSTSSGLNAEGFSTYDDSSPPPADNRPIFHRLRAVRQEQGLSLRRVAQQLKRDIEVVKQEEDPHVDLPLARLYEWQRVLEVPIADLLVDSDGALSAPVLERARLVRLMKGVAGILERTRDQTVRRLAEGMADTLKEIMPELEGVTPWHQVSDRRSVGRLGRIVQQVFTLDLRPE